MKTIYKLILGVIFFKISILQAQYKNVAEVEKIPLKNLFGRSNVFSRILPTKNIDKHQIGIYKGIDTLNVVNWDIWECYLSISPIFKDKLSTLVFVDHKDQKHIIVDINNNKDFSDDGEYIYDLENDSLKQYPLIELKWPILGNQKKSVIKLELDSYYNDNEKHTGISFSDRNYREGTFCKNNKRYKINIANNSFYLDPAYPSAINIREVYNETDDNGNSYQHKSINPINFGNNLYRVSEMSEDTLQMKFIGITSKSFGELYTSAPNIISTDLISGKKIDLKKYKGKLVVLDFWGSWCNPCIELIPHLVDFKRKYKTLTVISIALDNQKDLDKLKAIIKEKNINWVNLWVDRSKMANSIISDYRITAYPTTILIDEKNNIIVRGSGLDGLNKIEHCLQSKGSQFNF